MKIGKVNGEQMFNEKKTTRTSKKQNFFKDFYKKNSLQLLLFEDVFKLKN